MAATNTPVNTSCLDNSFDVLCVGHASYDLVFSVETHPGADEKTTASDLISCGGGPAANAAVTVARLGYRAAFAGYLGQDLYGDRHLQELIDHGIDTDCIVRGCSPTPLSAIIVKPDGKRALINYKGETIALAADRIDFSDYHAKVILFDGHEPHLSKTLVNQVKDRNIATVLDAGSVHEGTLALMQHVDYLACSEKFALQYAGDLKTALQKMAEFSPAVIITLGDQGLIWQRGSERGKLPAFSVDAIDTTGAGDAFHGALAAGIAGQMHWPDLLRFASAAGSLCCTVTGARPGMPTAEQLQTLIKLQSL